MVLAHLAQLDLSLEMVSGHNQITVLVYNANYSCMSCQISDCDGLSVSRC